MSKMIAQKLMEDIHANLKSADVVFPTFLDVTFKIRTALEDENISIDQMAKIISLEPVMSLKVIGMSNSVAMNPSGRPISDVKTAISRIGLQAVRTISFSAAITQLMQTKDMVQFDKTSRKLWEHTGHVAALCHVLAKKVAKINADEAMFTGLVHDIGAFYLMSFMAKIPELMADKAEVYSLLSDWHDDVGFSLLTAMKMSPLLCNAVMVHEQPRKLSEIKTIADVLYAANYIANLEDSWRPAEFAKPVVEDAISEAISDETLSEIIRESEEEILSLRSAISR